MQYLVCEEDSAEKIQNRVNERIREGWRPIGGLSVVESQASANWWYYQALIRDAEPSEATGPERKSAYSGFGDFD